MMGRWAAEYFDGVRRAVRERDGARAMIEAGGEQWRPGGPGGGGTPDPTAAAAIRLADMPERLEAWREAVRQCDAAIGEGLAVIEGVRAYFAMLYGERGGEYADVLDMVYVDLVPIKRAARIMGVSVNTAKTRMARAIRWLDEAGKARALDMAERAVLCAGCGEHGDDAAKGCF